MRRGFTIVELLMSMAILGMVVVAVGVLSQSVFQANEHTRAVGAATQHARVAMQRISQTVTSAYAAATEPGVAVIENLVGGESLPDTAVIWAPTGDPQNPDGPPLVGELVFYTPNPSNPMELWELTDPDNTTPQSLTTINSLAGRNLLATLTASPTTTKRTVMKRLQTIQLGGDDVALLRFSTRMMPTASEWTQLVAGSVAWENAAWPQSMYADDWGMRSVCLQMEMWTSIAPQSDPNAAPEEHSVPFVSAATLNDRLLNPGA